MIRLVDRYLYMIHIGQYAEAWTWESAMGHVQRHFSSGLGGRFAIFRYPDRLRGTQRWIIVKTDTP